MSDKNDIDVNAIAKNSFGIDYLFPFQRLVLANTLENLYYENEESIKRQLIILPTGAGKSLCFTLPVQVITGLTVVIFPLLSLIRDQQRRMQESGFETDILVGGQSQEERQIIWKKLETHQTKILLTNPEMLQTNMKEKLINIGITHLVIDEAHTVSEWGKTFRKSYLGLGDFIHECQPKLVSAFTATASKEILSDIKDILFKGETCHTIIGNPDRPNLSYQVVPTLCKERTLISMLQQDQSHLLRVQRPAIIFANSRNLCEKITHKLRHQLKDDQIKYYHAGLPSAVKKIIEAWFFQSKNGILVATCAYGMGVDKGNIRSVLHYQLPHSVESYLQETGRAGRDKQASKVFLLLHHDDINANASERYQNLIRVMLDNSSCRRIRLLSLLGLEIDDCNGCDVCDGSLISSDDEEQWMIKFIQKNKHLLTIHEAVNILKGYHSLIERNKQYQCYFGFAQYKKLEREWINDMIHALLAKGVIKTSKIAWKHKLYAHKIK